MMEGYQLQHVAVAKLFGICWFPCYPSPQQQPGYSPRSSSLSSSTTSTMLNISVFLPVSARLNSTGLAMFVVRVILGNLYVHSEDIPPLEIPCTEQDCLTPGCSVHVSKFDSVVTGTNRNFREFLVLDPKRCYPQYLVFYKREKVV